MTRTVTVTGHGVASAVPDRAVVRVAASHVAASVAEAVSGLDPASRAVSEVARDVVDPKDVATTGMQVWPSHDGEGRPSGFEASHQVRVVCGDLVAASSLLATLADRVGDALRVESVALEVGDPSEAVERARELAYADALARAEHLARLGGGALGDLLSVEEGGAGGEGPGAPRHAVAAVAIEPGEQEVRVQVIGTWQLV